MKQCLKTYPDGSAEKPALGPAHSITHKLTKLRRHEIITVICGVILEHHNIEYGSRREKTAVKVNLILVRYDNSTPAGEMVNQTAKDEEIAMNNTPKESVNLPVWNGPLADFRLVLAINRNQNFVAVSWLFGV